MAKRFVVCISNSEYPASLEKGKVYLVLRSAKGAEEGLVRIVDETGEDYLYPEELFSRARCGNNESVEYDPGTASKRISTSGYHG